MNLYATKFLLPIVFFVTIHFVDRKVLVGASPSAATLGSAMNPTLMHLKTDAGAAPIMPTSVSMKSNIHPTTGLRYSSKLNPLRLENLQFFSLNGVTLKD